MPLVEKIYTENEYFGISNCVFNFNFLPLVVYEILVGFQIDIREAYAPLTPPNCIFNFSFLSLVLYETLGWSRIYIRGAAPPPQCKFGTTLISRKVLDIECYTRKHN